MAAPPPDFEPPPWLKFARRHIWAIMGGLAIVTITLLRPYMRHIPEPPEVMFTLPSDYALIDHEGRPFTPETLQGEDSCSRDAQAAVRPSPGRCRISTPGSSAPTST